MTVQLDTDNRKAFDLVADALDNIDKYRKSHDVGRLTDASTRLLAAIELDPNYFRAKYYEALVDDLAGRFGDAVKKLIPLVQVKSSLQNEIRYNLGLAEYHGYSHEALDKAIAQFQLVLSSNPPLALSLRATAGLAQAYAMHMIPKQPTQPDTASIESFRQLTMEAAQQVQIAIHNAQSRLRWPSHPQLDPAAIKELSFTIRNAQGMALMYYSDYVLYPVTSPNALQLAARVELLADALRELQQAEELNPDDWANRCDLGSANMRMGYVTAQGKYFETALGFLQDVVDRLRPGYPFAKYEMGRVDRLAKRFDVAIRLFEAVLKVPEKERDVSDRRVKIELERARQSDGSFP